MMQEKKAAIAESEKLHRQVRSLVQQRKAALKLDCNVEYETLEK
jgi:hypothetical protein